MTSRKIVFAKMSTWQLFALVLISVVLMLVYLTKNSDFDVFYAAALRYSIGAKVHLNENSAFAYPTVISMVLAPLTLTGDGVARVVLGLLSVFCMIAGIRIINSYLLADNTKWVFLLAMLFSSRFFVSVFEHQQSDLYVFATIVIGLHCYSNNRLTGPLYLAGAALLKSNPLFLILLPLFQRRLKAFFLIFLVCITGVVLPDLVRPDAAENQNNSFRDGFLSVNDRYLNINSEPTFTRYQVIPASNNRFSHIEDYADLLYFGDYPKWWQRKGNYLNQSISNTTLKLLPDNVISATSAFVLWCGIFSILLFYLINAGSKNTFIIGLLFYSAFVLIGPMASKPHFVAFYGLLIYAWNEALIKPGILKVLSLLFMSAIFGLTSADLFGDFAKDLANHGHIALSGLYLWGYVFVCELLKLKTEPIKQ